MKNLNDVTGDFAIGQLRQQLSELEYENLILKGQLFNHQQVIGEIKEKYPQILEEVLSTDGENNSNEIGRQQNDGKQRTNKNKTR